MQSNLDFLVVYAEIIMAFIAFATIVATLRDRRTPTEQSPLS